MKRTNGRSTSGIAGFGRVRVSGRRRVPSPADEDKRLHQVHVVPVRAADALVGEPGGAERLARRGSCGRRPGAGSPSCPRARPSRARRTPATRSRGRRRRRRRAPPPPSRTSRRSAGARRRRSPRHGVVGADVRALALEARREHQARRLSHVVGVGLERQAQERDPACRRGSRGASRAWRSRAASAARSPRSPRSEAGSGSRSCRRAASARETSFGKHEPP